jgi:hypothetical protein
LPVNVAQIAKMAQQMQTQMAQVQAELAETTLEATAGGGAVTVIITGSQEIRSVKIDPSAVNADDVDLLEDLVRVAINEAISQSRALAEQRMAAVTGGLSLPGLSLPR